MDLTHFLLAALCLVVASGSFLAIGFLMGMEHEYKATRKRQEIQDQAARIFPDGFFRSQEDDLNDTPCYCGERH